jgi:integrase
MRLHLYKRGDVWWVRGSEGGLKFRRSTKHKSESLARRLRDRWEREIADPVHFRAHQATIDRAAERFMRELRVSAKSQGTVRFYDVKVKHVQRLLGRVRLAKITHEKIVDYIAKREAEGAHQYSIHRELTALRRILRSAARANEWRGDLKLLMPAYSTGYVPMTDWVTAETIWAAIGELGPARGAAVAWCIATASDFSSLFTAKRADVEARHVLVRGTKTTSRLRKVPRVGVFAPFLDYALKHGGEDVLFESWANMPRDVRAACRRAGVPEFTAKTLRRSAATWMVRAGVPYDIAAKFLGHGSTTMLQKVYGQLAPEDAARLIDERMPAATVPAVYPTHAKPADSVDAKELGNTPHDAKDDAR